MSETSSEKIDRAIAAYLKTTDTRRRAKSWWPWSVTLPTVEQTTAFAAVVDELMSYHICDGSYIDYLSSFMDVETAAKQLIKEAEDRIR